MLEVGQSLQVVIAVIGLILNATVGSIVTFGLGLKGMDLKLILLISLLDVYYYLHNILRMALIGSGYLNLEGEANPGTLWWCPFDSTMDMTNTLSCIELVAILSFMRYLSICKKKNLNSKVWYLVCAISYFSNLIFALVYLNNGEYKWSKTKLVCLYSDNEEAENYQFFKNYYYFWFLNYIVRSFLSLVIIAYSYFNVTSVYYEIISSTGDMVLKQQISSNIEGMNHPQSGNQYFDSSIVEDYKQQQKQINQQKWSTTIKLFGAILAYSLCFIPDIILNIIGLIPNGGIEGIDINFKIASNLLVSCYGVVSAIFVLLSHDPSRRYLAFKMECLVGDFKSLFNIYN